MTYTEAYEKGKAALTSAGVGEAALDARLLLEFVCGTDRNTLLVHGDMQPSEDQQLCYERLIAKRAERIPLQQLTGSQSFMGLEFAVNENVLIPRQDTEILVEEALRKLHDGMRVLDMCTGSGCILISLLYYSNQCTGIGADISAEALQLAGQNARRLLAGRTAVVETEAGMQEVFPAGFVQGDLFEGLEGEFDLIVSNPPYIRTGVIETLEPEVREHEPRLALDGTADGLAFYRRIVAESSRFLKKGGMLLFEIGFDQGRAVKELMEQAGYLDVHVTKDYAGLDRVVSGTLAFAE